MEINKENAWDIINYYLSHEWEFTENEIKDKIPDDTDEAILFLKQHNMVDFVLYKLLVLKKELLTNVGGDEIPST